MRKLALNGMINIISFYLAAVIFTSIKMDSSVTAVLAGTILVLVNIIIRPLLMIVALPLNLISMGLFILAINTWMVMLAAKITPGLYISSFWTAMVIAIIITSLNFLFSRFIEES